MNLNSIYIQSIAFTKAVNKNGKVTQNHSGRKNKKAIQATNETKVMSQYIPAFSVLEAMLFMIILRMAKLTTILYLLVLLSQLDYN
jgi:hypothetical protein